jgi:hypothetical protein
VEEKLSGRSNNLAAIRTLKYKESGGTLFLDTKEIYLLNENICQDIMQVSLLSRNNDIYVDDCKELIRSDKVDLREFRDKIDAIKSRLLGLEENLWCCSR